MIDVLQYEKWKIDNWQWILENGKLNNGKHIIDQCFWIMGNCIWKIYVRWMIWISENKKWKM